MLVMWIGECVHEGVEKRGGVVASTAVPQTLWLDQRIAIACGVVMLFSPLLSPSLWSPILLLPSPWPLVVILS